MCVAVGKKKLLSNREIDILAYETVFFNVDYLCKIPYGISFKEKKNPLKDFQAGKSGDHC